jgi:hypothetical protein
MTVDHYDRMPGRATLLVRAMDGILGTHKQAVAAGGLAAVAAARPGPKGASKLTGAVVARIRRLDAAGQTLTQIAAAAGVSTFSVRNALGRVPARNTSGTLDAGGDDLAGASEPAGGPVAQAASSQDDQPAGNGREAGAASLPVLPDVVARDGERALARTGLMECAAPVFTPGAKYPLAGLLLVLPALVPAGLLEVAGQVYGRLRNGSCGLDSVLLEAVFRALLGEARAEGATRIAPADPGRVLGLDRGPEVKTIRRKLGELAGRGKAAELVAGMARRHALNRPEELGFLYADGHVRACQGTRKVQKAHVARLRFPAPATLETWVSDAAGEPVFVVMASPSASLAAELRRLIPDLSAITAGRQVTVGFDRGGWSPALFADLTEAGFDVLTYRKGTIPDIGAAAFTPASHTDEHGRQHDYDLADTSVALDITDGPRKGQAVTMRQVTRRQASGHQVHVLTTRAGLPAAEIAYRMFSRWRQENYFRYARLHFHLDSHDTYAATPDDPARLVPNPAKKTAYAAAGKAQRAVDAAEVNSDAALLALHSPAPGQAITITNLMLAAINAPLQAAWEALDAAVTAHQAIPARIALGDLAPGTVLLDTETKLITHAIRMAAYNAQAALARSLYGTYRRADDEAYSLIREALTGTGDIHPADGILNVRLEPLSAPRRTRALATLCEQLNATQTRYPGTDLTLRYQVKSRPDLPRSLSPCPEPWPGPPAVRDPPAPAAGGPPAGAAGAGSGGAGSGSRRSSGHPHAGTAPATR